MTIEQRIEYWLAENSGGMKFPALIANLTVDACEGKIDGMSETDTFNDAYSVTMDALHKMEEAGSVGLLTYLYEACNR